MEHVKLALIEDNPRYRATLEDFFRLAPGFDLMAVFGSAEALLTDVKAKAAAGVDPSWKIAMMDIELPGMNGIEATRVLKRMLPDRSVIMLTMFEEPSTILEAITAGADGYLLKRSNSRELLDQLRTITSGGAPLTSAVARTILEVLRCGDPGLASTGDSEPGGLNLTDREHDVLRCLVSGSSYKEVAAELGITIHTVRFHVKGVYRKLQVHSVAEAVRKAVQQRLV